MMNNMQVKALWKSKQAGKHAIGGGLYLRVTVTGSALWVVRYSIFKRRREISIGQYPEMSLADANAETALIKKGLKNNIDPLVERDRETVKQINTVDDLANDWLEVCDKRLKHSSIPRQIYRDYIAPKIGKLPLDQVTPRDIRTIISQVAELGFKSRANHVLIYSKQMFKHAVKMELMVSNPASAFNADDAGGKEQSRDRALSLDELETVFASLKKGPFSRRNYIAVSLLVLLGLRKKELLYAKWSEFDSKTALFHLPKERSKSGVAIKIPLPNLALRFLKEQSESSKGSVYVFPKWEQNSSSEPMSHSTVNSALGQLFNEEKIVVQYFTVHDLRRTFRSLLAGLGVHDHIAERCLNHKQKGIVGVYNRYDYLDERREALDILAESLEPIIG